MLTTVPARLGPWSEGSTAFVRSWAPDHHTLELCLYSPDGQPRGAPFPMEREPGGYFLARVPDAPRPFLYKLRIDGEGPFPDPWSRHQPLGVHGPSSHDDEPFAWTDAGWKGVRAEDLVLYEAHVGTATAEGTFEALIPRLSGLRELGITALELLPVASAAGQHGWGYDGVSLFAPFAPYGGPRGLKRLIDAAHRVGLGVLIDAVYNHFGPDGNYLSLYAKAYFTSAHKTPWGDAINYAEPVVRELALSSAEMWIREFHADGLRLDATHTIVDDGEPHLLRALAERARAAAPERAVLVTAEDERNEATLVSPVAAGGHGLDGVWADDFHHQLRRAFAGDSEGYYRDYTGSTEDIARTLEEGWFYVGQRSENLGHARGTPGADLPPTRFIHCLQNHDQVGNRPFGNRLGDDVSPAAFRAMSASLLLSPYTPLLFAGQEWNSRTPFLFFTDHHAELGKLVTEGRRKEFAGFAAFAGAQVPDPQAEETFLRSKLTEAEQQTPEAAQMRELYRTLLALRRTHPALLERSRKSFSAQALGPRAFCLERQGGGERLTLVVNVKGPLELELDRPQTLALHTEERRFGGAGGEPTLSGKQLRCEGPLAVVLLG